ncbi:MAG: hypothetical protein K0Q90_953 [Paenibacillaceae bacterium]|jgi:hypothetical protein|nr:hypothetical protein [Paenibacillaceae bacterium]
MSKLKSGWMGLIVLLGMLSFSSAASEQAYGAGSFIERMKPFKEDCTAAGIWQGAWKYGYLNASGQWLVEPRFDKAESFQDGFAVVGMKSEQADTFKLGYIRKDGTYLIEPHYDFAFDFEGDYAIVGMKGSSHNEYGVINKLGQLIVPVQYEHITANSSTDKANKGSYSFELIKNGLYGLYLPKMNKLVEPEYTSHFIMLDEYAMTYKNDKIGFIFFNSGKVMEPQFDNRTYVVQETGYDSYGVEPVSIKEIGVQVEKNGKYGVFDLNGSTLLDIKYEEIRFTEANVFVAESNGKQEIIRKNGVLLVKEQFDDISSYNWRYHYYVTLGGKKGILKQDGSYLLTPQYDDIDRFDLDGYAKIKLNGKEGVLDSRGKVVLEPVYDFIITNYRSTTDSTKPDMIKATKDGKDILFHKDFTPVTAGENTGLGDYDTIGQFEHGIAMVQKNGKAGYVREDYSYIVEPVYDSAFQARHGEALMDYFSIKQGDKWGAVLMDGTVIRPIFDNPPTVSEGIGVGAVQGRHRYINKSNRDLNDEIYKLAYPFQSGRGLVCQEYGQYYFIDQEGHKVSKVYQDASSYGEGIAFVKEGRYGWYVDEHEQPVLGKDMQMIKGYSFINGIAPVEVYVPAVEKYLYGIMRRDGTWLVEPVFDQVRDYGEGQYKYYLDKKEGEVTAQGKIIWK